MRSRCFLCLFITPRHTYPQTKVPIDGPTRTQTIAAHNSVLPTQTGKKSAQNHCLCHAPNYAFNSLFTIPQDARPQPKVQIGTLKKHTQSPQRTSRHVLKPHRNPRKATFYLTPNLRWIPLSFVCPSHQNKQRFPGICTNPDAREP